MTSKSLKLHGNHFHAIAPGYTLAAEDSTTFIIERAFGKTRTEIEEWVARMERILAPVQQEVMDATEILFTIPQHKDPNNTLYETAKHIFIRGKQVIPVSVVQPENHVGQFWTSCLNAPIALAASVVKKREWSEITFIPKSFETDLDAQNAELLAESIKCGVMGGFIGRRVMPPNIAYIDTDFSAHTLIELAGQHYVKRNIDPGELLLKWTSCGRNTLAHWPLSVFETMGMFNPACGLIQGMEDWELLLRAVIDNKTPFLLPANEIWYDDIRLKSLAGRRSDDKDVVAQQAKLNGEIPTLRAIFSWLATEYANRNKGVKPGEDRMHRSPHEAEFELRAELSFA